MAETQRENFADASLCGFWRDVFIYAFYHYCMELNELVHNLLIWLKLKLTHLLTKIEQEIVSNHRAHKSENQRCKVRILVQERIWERNLSYIALRGVFDRG